jgi:hypothetical protein
MCDLEVPTKHDRLANSTREPQANYTRLTALPRTTSRCDYELSIQVINPIILRQRS